MKTLMNLIMIILFVVTSACTNEKVIRQEGRGEATGKSNGGDNIQIEPELIREKLNQIKPLLLLVFEGLKFQAKAETWVPTSTDLDNHVELVEVLLRMTHFGVAGKSVFDDIETEANIVIQDEPCTDYEGDGHIAATNLEEIGGEICFSVSEIQTGLPVDSEVSFDIQILALAAHEFLHHFYSSGSKEKDEVVANLMQRFVIYQLHKFSEIDDDIIATNIIGYVTRFQEGSKKLMNRSNQAQNLSDEELDEMLERRR